MTSPSSELPSPAPILGEARYAPSERRTAVSTLARAILALALALGVAADLLLRDGFTGLGFPAWLALVALGTVALVRRAGRPMPTETASWLAVALVFGIGMAWRDAGHLQFLDFLAVLLALGLAAVALGAPRSALFAARLRDTLWAGVTQIASIVAGPVPIVFRDVALPAPTPEARGRIRPVVRAMAIALPLLLIFGLLLRDADPVFASLLALPDLDLETIISHVVVIGFFAWVVAGWARGALIADLTRHRAPEHSPFTLEKLDVTVALGALIALFAAYVATQLGWFFGGERFLQARTGLTAAEYARQGFFQMVLVVMLVVPVLLGSRAALRPGRALERRHTTLALPLIALLGVMILSAVLRMRLYVHYYGLTVERLYPLVFMGWLAVVLVWLALTVLRGAGRTFVAGAVVSGLATLAALNVAIPDLIVARVNIARASGGVAGARPTLDLEHLASLSGETVPLAVAAVLAPLPVIADSVARARASDNRCAATDRLLGRRPSSWELARREGDGARWRRWNWGKAEGERAATAYTAALLAVKHASCPRPLRPSRRPIVPAGR